MSQATGTDSRTPGFFIVDNEVVTEFKLGPYAGWLYIVIVSHINQKTGVAFPSLSTLAKEAGMSEPTVIKYLGVLVENNLLQIHQGQDDKGNYSANNYELLPVKGVVKEVNQGGKAGLPGVVKEVKGNNTNTNKTNEQDEEQEQKDSTEPPAAVGPAVPVVASDETTADPVEEPEADPPTPPDEKQPHIAIIEDGYLATLKQLGRIVIDGKRDPIKSRVSIAAGIRDAGFTWEDVRGCIVWYYSDKNTDDVWLKNKTKPLTLEQVAERVGTWVSHHKPKPPVRLVVPVPEWRRKLDAEREVS